MINDITLIIIHISSSSSSSSIGISPENGEQSDGTFLLECCSIWKKETVNDFYSTALGHK